MPKYDPERTEEIIARGRELVAKARRSVADCQRILAERGLDPERCLEEVRRAGGDAAVEAIQRDVQVLMKRIQEEAERDRLHGSQPSRVANRVALRAARI